MVSGPRGFRGTPECQVACCGKLRLPFFQAPLMFTVVFGGCSNPSLISKTQRLPHLPRSRLHRSHRRVLLINLLLMMLPPIVRFGPSVPAVVVCAFSSRQSIIFCIVLSSIPSTYSPTFSVELVPLCQLPNHFRNLQQCLHPRW